MKTFRAESARDLFADRLPIRRLAPIVAAVIALSLLFVSDAAAARRIFYLTARPGMCLIATSKAGGAGHKYVSDVPCRNAKHNFEVFAVRRGGWGKTAVPANAPARVLTICRAAYRHVTGHPLRAPGGVYGFWPDPGTEQARYGDKVICSYILYPSFAPLGAGRTVGAVRRATTGISIGAQSANKPVHGLVWANIGESAQISGVTGDGQEGTEVQLEASAFPFASSPTTVDQTQTGSGGSYSFTVKPHVATHYFVELVSDPTTKSPVITVYAAPHWASYTRGSCTGVLVCHLRFSATVVYSAAVAKREGAKEVYYYFGVRYGSQTTPPSSLRLVKTGRQRRRGHQYRETFSVTFPTVTAYHYQWVTCTKDTEAEDGIGLPGHNHCGGHSITRAALQQGYIG